MEKIYTLNGLKTNILVSDNGTVIDINTKQPASTYKNSAGYIYVRFKTEDGEKHRKGLHCIVAETFIPNPENKKTVNHEDGIKSHNCASNLSWMTQSENNIHACKTGLRHPAEGANVHFAKYSEDIVELACKEMSLDNLSLNEIYQLTKIPVKTLSEIRCRKIWKSISKKYEFPKNKNIASRIGISNKDLKKIKKLIRKGKTNKEIYEITGISKNKKISKSMTYFRSKYFNNENLMNKVQRLSNTEDSNNNNNIEETFFFTWESEK